MGYLLKFRMFHETLTCNGTESVKGQDRNRHGIWLTIGERDRQTEKVERKRVRDNGVTEGEKIL